MDSDKVAIGTGLRGNKVKEILSSVIGQLSDGLWENSPSSEHYWRFADVEIDGDGEVVILVDSRDMEKQSIGGRVKWIENWFVTKMDLNKQKIREFFANKVKAIAKEELKDNKDEIGWDRANYNTSTYVSYGEDITFAEVYFVYEILKGRENGLFKKYDGDIIRELAW